MIRALLRHQSRRSYPFFPLQTLTLTLTLAHRPHSTRTWNPHNKIKKNQKKRRNNNNKEAPPPDPSLLARAISSLPPRPTSSDLTLALSSLPDPRLAPDLLSWAHHRHPRLLRLDPSPFHLAIKILGRNRLYDHLHSLSHLSLSLPRRHSLLSEPLLNTIIYFYAEARMLFRAISVYNFMRDSADPSLRPTLRTYNLLFAALLGRGANSYIHYVYMDTLRALFRQMVDSAVAPDSTAINFVVRGYVQSMHVNDALRIFHQMGPVYGIDPDANTYSYLVHGLCAQGRTRNAAELYGEMRGKGFVPSLRAGNSLVSALAMGGEAGEAARVMWEVVGLGREVDGVTVRTLVEAACRDGGGIREAEALVREMRERSVVDARLYWDLLEGIRQEYGDNLPHGEPTPKVIAIWRMGYFVVNFIMLNFNT